jgi:hypothetical protein
MRAWSQQETGFLKNRSVARFYGGNLRYLWACCVLGSKSLTRCLGMPPNGEIAIPFDINTLSALGVNDFEILNRRFISGAFPLLAIDYN